MQLRLGLGTRPRDRRHLAGGAGRALAHAPGWPRCDPGHGRRRRRPGRGARRRGAGHRDRGWRSAPTCEAAPRRSRRGRRHRRAPSLEVPDAGAVVAARPRRPAALRPAGRAAAPTARAVDSRRPARRVPQRASSTPRRTPTARRSRSSSTASRCSSRAPTGSPTTASRTGSTATRYATRLARPTEAGINLLRVWGGGIFESDDFYDVCDEPGSWCGRTSSSPAPRTPRRSRCAARSSPRRATTSPGSCPHPSLVVWNGNNENLWGYDDWGWRRELGDLTGARLLPRAAARADRRRAGPDPPVLARQPVVRSTDASTRTTPTTAPCTSWDVWNQLDYTAYRDYRAAVRRRVRLPGAAGLVDADRRDVTTTR